jgi:hypothetical protein
LRQFEAGGELALCYSQVGLSFISDHAAYLTVCLRSPKALSLAELRALTAKIDVDSSTDDRRWVVTIGVRFELWSRWCSDAKVPLDPDLFADEPGLRAVLQNNQPPYALSGATFSSRSSRATWKR